MFKGLPKSQDTSFPKPYIDPGSLVLSAVFIIFSVLMLVYGQAGVASDGSNYFAYLRSMFFDGDLDFHNEFSRFNKAFWDTYRPKETVTGYYTNVFSVGPAILWSPFYLAAHLFVLTANLAGAGIKADGFSGPYLLSVNLASVFYSFIGIILTYRLCTKYFSRVISLISALTVLLGSFILYYTFAEPYMSHAVSFFTVTLFIYLWLTTRSERSTLQWITLGLAAGLMMLVRWQNGLMMIIPAVEAVVLYVACLRTRDTARAVSLLKNNLLFLLFVLVGFLPQMAAWNSIYGSFFTIPQGTAFMRWEAPFIMEVLFSSRHGLYAWTPLVYTATLGWLTFFKLDRLFAFCGLLAFAIMTFVNSIVTDWWAGWGFGMRRYDGFILLFAIGLAALLNKLRQVSNKMFYAVVLLLVFFAGYNLFLMNVYLRGDIHKGGPVAFNTVLKLDEDIYRWTGYPFSFPANLIFSRRYGLPPSRYDTLVGGYIDDPYFYGDTIKPGTDPTLLGTGWSPPVSFEGTLSRRFTKKALIYAPVRIVTDFSMTIKAAGEAIPDPEILVLLNGKRAGTITPKTGLGEFTLKLSKANLRHGINTVEFINSRESGTFWVEYIRFTRLEYVPSWK